MAKTAKKKLLFVWANEISLNDQLENLLYMFWESFCLSIYDWKIQKISWNVNIQQTGRRLSNVTWALQYRWANRSFIWRVNYFSFLFQWGLWYNRMNMDNLIFLMNLNKYTTVDLILYVKKNQITLLVSRSLYTVMHWY